MLPAPVVAAEELLDKIGALADQGWRLVTATCVDTGSGFEVLYHLDRERELLHLRVDVPRDGSVPSIGDVYPGATFLENEMKDLFGLSVTGLAVDYHGRMLLAEDGPVAPMAKWGADERPPSLPAVPPTPPAQKPLEPEQAGRRTVVPFGPQHPVLPEPMQLRLVLEDEQVVDVVPAVGYVHRGLEKLAEVKDYTQNVFIVERVCGICSFMHALSYCLGIERLMGVEVPKRADYLRVIWSELHRMHSHLLWAGLYADALGFESLFMEAWRTRELIMDLLEATAGNRVIISTSTIGGVRRDIDESLAAKVREGLQRCERDLGRLIPAFLDDPTIHKRTVGKGVVSKEDAQRYGAIGPIARGTGLRLDMRLSGYAAYGDLGFEPIVVEGGDAYARAKVRLLELRQSAELVRRALDEMPDGEIAVPVKGNPSGEIVTRVEQPRGEVLYYLRANGTKQLERLRVRTPTFATMPLLFKMIPGSELADVPVLVLSIDPCVSCTER